MSSVHVPYEGASAGTELTVAFDQIRAGAAELPPDLRAPIAIYCRSGRMSAMATGTLAGD
ncbi:MAG: rhodanese-like domain-containing protein [Actinomycetota bacterium]|nr:rhodanese-like domain-containing protein [Actinomycetota bacterium]